MKTSDLPPNFLLDSLQAELRDEASRCVACGLCLPHCPTYRITLSEADSPRGRIALISGVAGERIPANARFGLHVDRCLTCRACEAACPSNVKFGQLIDGAKTMIAALPSDSLNESARARKSLYRRVAERGLIAKPRRLDGLRPLLHFYQRSGLQKWLRESGLFRKTKLALLEAQLPAFDGASPVSAGTGRARTWQQIYPAAGKPRGNVGLFIGCIARLTDVSTLNAGIFVLNRLGYTVHVPQGQTCCGALQLHDGDVRAAAKLAYENVQAFDGLKLDSIISMASGCGAQFAQYPSLSRSQSAAQPQKEAAFSALPTRRRFATGLVTPEEFPNPFASALDVSAFLANAEGWDDVKLDPLPQKVAVHDPCSLRNVSNAADHPYALLARIPGACIVPLAGNDQCCGAAGTYFLDQPKFADILLREKVAALEASGARYLATSNVGCSMHIASGLRKRGAEVEVLHPVSLLARQIRI